MSDSLQEYKIPHAGLKKGVHEFSYELTETALSGAIATDVRLLFLFPFMPLIPFMQNTR